MSLLNISVFPQAFSPKFWAFCGFLNPKFCKNHWKLCPFQDELAFPNTLLSVCRSGCEMWASPMTSLHSEELFVVGGVRAVAVIASPPNGCIERALLLPRIDVFLYLRLCCEAWNLFLAPAKI